MIVRHVEAVQLSDAYGCLCGRLFVQSADFAGHLLAVLLCNTLLYMVFYLSMKLLHGERPRWYAWLYLAGATAAWTPGLYFFVSGSTDWYAPAITLAAIETGAARGTVYNMLHYTAFNIYR